MWAAHGRQGLKAAVLLFTAQLEAGQDILSLLMDSNGSFVLCGCRDGKLAVSPVTLLLSSDVPAFVLVFVPMARYTLQ